MYDRITSLFTDPSITETHNTSYSSILSRIAHKHNRFELFYVKIIEKKLEEFFR